MGDKKQITKSGLILLIVSWLIFIVVYWLSFYEAYTLSRFGRFKNNITILIGCMVFFLLWFIILVIRIIKKPAAAAEQSEEEYEFYSRCRTKRNIAIILVIVIITCIYGVKIYHNAINYNGKLSWYLHDLKDKRTVMLIHSNIYESGVEGIFTDINKKLQMPEKLYISSNFTLNFDTNGTITSFDTFLYGKNDKGKLESYLISYNSSKSKDITIYLNGYTNANYSEDKLLEPFLKTMKVIKLKETVSKWPNEKYGILYSGKRSFGYNTTGIVNIDSNGNIAPMVNAYSEIIGYTVSVYVPGKENKITPVRYNLTEYLNDSKAPKSTRSNGSSSNEYKNNVDEFYLTKQVGFRLEVTGAALGSRAYSLTGTVDGGQSFTTINEDPFSGMLGSAAGITFLNDKLGFLGLSYSGGTKGELFRTEDGGKSYKKVSFPEVKAALSNGAEYNPFDLPEMPYEKDGTLNVLVGQGADGDYKGGCKALYQSTDKGTTWKYVNEVNK